MGKLLITRWDIKACIKDNDLIIKLFPSVYVVRQSSSQNIQKVASALENPQGKYLFGT